MGPRDKAWAAALIDLRANFPMLVVHAGTALAGADVSLFHATAYALVRSALVRGARRVEITVDQMNGCVFARVMDDGTTPAVPAEASAALAEAGGTVTLERTGAHGTSVVFSFDASAGQAASASAA
jgi:hypothetical protein